MATKLFFPSYAICLLLAGLGLLFSCSKSSFLDKKPNTDFIIPTTLPDFQSLLDNDIYMGGTPVLGELSADNYYLDYSFWLPLDAKQHNAYIWAPDTYNGQGQVDDWDYPYKQVFYANVVLEGLPKVATDSSNQQEWNTIRGEALFMRAYAFYNLAQIFAPVYDSTSAVTDLGIPLRLNTDINAVSVRATLQATYDQIEKDLRVAYTLLPAAVPAANLNRPSKPAALAMLARMYLSKRTYVQAGNCADSCLQLYSRLIDYSALTTIGMATPIPRLNVETIYQSSFIATATNLVLKGVVNPSCIVDSVLYRSYAAGDLRPLVFYRLNSNTGYPNLIGSYNGSIFPFSGLATDEVYLIRAECRARTHDITGALGDLNTLLKARWSGTFPSYSASSWEEALDTILLERRKELAFRGLRWTDLRRLNKEGRNITLMRNLNGQTYQLTPNSPLYVLPIPPDVIALSRMTQNPRPQQ